MRALTIAVALVVTAVSVVPFAMKAQQNSSAPAGTIQGTVAKSDSGDPLANAKVTLAGGPGGAQAIQNLLAFAASQGVVITTIPPGTSDEQIMQSLLEEANAKGLPIGPADIQSALDSVGGAKFPTTTADTSGHFTFANVPAGRYTVRVERNGYFGTSINGPIKMALVNVTVTNGQTAVVTVSMTPTAIISGRVRDSAGRPMSNVDVQAYRVFYQGGMPLLDPVVSKSTDDLGEFRLIWVLPGEYYVGVTPRPPSAASIAARNPQDVATFFPEATDTLTAVPIALRAGEEASGINIGVRKVKPFHISGRVNSSVIPPPISQGAQGVFVTINQQQNSTATMFIIPHNTGSAEQERLDSVGSVVLNASSGAFDIPNILPGSYDLYARVFDQNGPVFSRIEVDVVNQDVTGLTVNVRPSAEVSGSVTIAAPGGTAPSFESWRVTLEPVGSLAKMGFGIRAGPIGARISPISKEGTYHIQGVPPGHYRLNISGMPAGMYVDNVRQNGTSVLDSGFDVGLEPPTPLQIAVKSAAGSVAGVARPGAVVALIPTGHRENHAMYYGATADAMGAFAFHSVAPGEYKIFAWDSAPPGAYLNADFLKKYEDAGRPLNVAADSKVRTDVTVIQ